MDQINIISIEFVGFVLVTLALYYALPRLASKWTALEKVIRFLSPSGLQNILLLVASYFFYYTWSSFFIYNLALITFINFFFGLWLQKDQNHKKAILRSGILLNLIILAWYMLGGPFVRDLDTIPFDIKKQIFSLIVLPVGISY